MKKPKPKHLFLDQMGNKFYARTVAELRAQIENGGSRVGRMYVDNADGHSYRIGYVIGRHWLTEYAPVRIKA